MGGPDAAVAFLPVGLARLERRAAEVLRLIREAFLRGLSTRAVDCGSR